MYILIIIYILNWHFQLTVYMPINQIRSKNDSALGLGKNVFIFPAKAYIMKANHNKKHYIQ